MEDRVRRERVAISEAFIEAIRAVQRGDCSCERCASPAFQEALQAHVAMRTDDFETSKSYFALNKLDSAEGMGQIIRRKWRHETLRGHKIPLVDIRDR